MSECPTFHGKSQKELQTFNVGWKNIFRGREDASTEAWIDRINLAGQRLRGNAAMSWNRNKEVYTTWDQFVRFLRTTLADPAVRMAEALQTLYRKQQKEHQKVHELLAEIEALEEDIPEMTEEVRKAWILLLAVKPEIRTRILSEHKEVTSREQVLASAARHEQALALEATTKARDSRSTSGQSRVYFTSKSHESRNSNATQHNNRKPEDVVANSKEVRTTVEKETGNKGPKCFKCHKFGHTSFQCTKRGGSTQEASKTHSESKN